MTSSEAHKGEAKTLAKKIDLKDEITKHYKWALDNPTILTVSALQEEWIRWVEKEIIPSWQHEKDKLEAENAALKAKESPGFDDSRDLRVWNDGWDKGFYEASAQMKAERESVVKRLREATAYPFDPQRKLTNKERWKEVIDNIDSIIADLEGKRKVDPELEAGFNRLARTFIDDKRRNEVKET